MRTNESAERRQVMSFGILQVKESCGVINQRGGSSICRSGWGFRSRRHRADLRHHRRGIGGG